MTGIVETVENISLVMDKLIDFVVSDTKLSGEFEKFLIKNKIEIQKESDLNSVLIDYLFEEKMENGQHVLDYFEEKNPNVDKNIIFALKNAFVSVFKINKISKNSYLSYDLASENDFTLTPLVKTTSLRGLGLYDYIKARVIELSGNFYLLEIFDVFGSLKEYEANFEAVKSIIKNPKIAVLNNKEKLKEIKISIKSFHSSFIECFNKNEIITSNKNIDELLNNFYKFHKGEIEKVEFEPLKDDFDYKFFEIQEFKNNILLNAASGFSSDNEYDIGLYSDCELGLFLIPFLGSFNEILKGKEIEQKEALIKEFLLNDKIPPSILIEKNKEFTDFIDIINKTLDCSFSSVDEIVDIYKQNYKDKMRLSSVSILYNSTIFSKILGHKEENVKKQIGRNDPCPCGSGKKYKKCCLLKGE